MRFFNTTGPIDPNKHYFVPHRLNKSLLKQLINEERYFILHAPRQSGKTTTMTLFVNELNAQGNYKALYINVEPAQVARGDVDRGMKIIIKEIKEWAADILPNDHAIIKAVQDELHDISGSSLKKVLRDWCVASDKPILLFIDEIDSLVGDTLISVLRQIRAGYINRPKSFPQSVCLIGVRDVRDYRIWSETENNMVLGGSAFNIKAESLVLPNFSLEQISNLYHQHTQETGQQFTDEAIEYTYYLTGGQPWLVNALAYQACFRDITDRSQQITKAVVEKAKEALIVRRDTHLDVLIDRLQEPRVRGIIDAILSGAGEEQDFKIDDLQYARDLGLLTQKGAEIANPIYQEIIPRELVYSKQETIAQKTIWYQREDESLDIHKILHAFTKFYRENSDIWLEKFAYKEAGPHLLLMAFLQRIINGGGTIHREYALGRKRVDLLINWKNQRIIIELKVNRGDKTISEGLKQTVEYMDLNNATEGHLVIFDRTLNKPWDEKVFTKKHIVCNHSITVWGM